MSRPMFALRRPLACAIALLVIAAATAVAAPAPAAGPPCGSSTLATIEAVDGSVANSVYGGELEGAEAVADSRHVASSASLLRAVARNDPAATLAVVKRIVYHPLWHIVRLEVLDASGTVLATYGGRYVLAPVSGELLRGERVVGSYLMSVQDDVGFAKLETRFVGDPIGIYGAGGLITALGARLPRQVPTASTLPVANTDYNVISERYRAVPTGALTAVILVPPPAASLASEPCIAVRTDEIGRVAERIAARYHPLEAAYRSYVETVESYTGATVVVRVGSRVAAGAEPGTGTLPRSGPASGSWWVFSFARGHRARVYVLVADQ